MKETPFGLALLLAVCAPGCADAPEAEEPLLAAQNLEPPEGEPGQQLFRMHHVVDIAPGRYVHVTEVFSVQSLGHRIRSPRGKRLA